MRIKIDREKIKLIKKNKIDRERIKLLNYKINSLFFIYF